MPATDPIDSGEFGALVDELRADAPVAPERLRQRVLELAPAPRGHWSRRRRLVLVVVPAAAALAVGAALVHGFVSSGPKAHMAATLAEKKSIPAPSTKTRRLGPATTTTAAAGAATHEKALTAQDAPSATIPTNRLVHADASLSVRVADRAALSRATTKATQIVASFGGYAQSVHYQSSRQGSGAAVLALRVPVKKAQAAISKLETLGTLLSQQLSTQDLQQQLTHQTNRIGSLKRAIAVYEQALQSGTLSASQQVEIQIRLANARHALTNQRKARSGTIASGATADISLTLTTKRHAGAAAPAPRGRLDRMLGSAAGFLGLEAMIVLYALVVLSPVLVLGGLGWALVRERRRRDEKHLLASS